MASPAPAAPARDDARPLEVVLVAFALGVAFAHGAQQAWRDDATASATWASVVGSRPLSCYLAALAVFHLAEYAMTARYRPDIVSVDSFLIRNGWQYHVAHGVAVVEYVVSSLYGSPAPWAGVRRPTVFVAGLAGVLGAQGLRSLAMATAASGFSHVVATRKREDHRLVTHGVYAWSRHPSYVAFFYWAIATQVMLGNVVCFVAFAVVLWRYFAARIRGALRIWRRWPAERLAAEERYLVHFFGDAYRRYSAVVPTRLPGIS